MCEGYAVNTSFAGERCAIRGLNKAELIQAVSKLAGLLTFLFIGQYAKRVSLTNIDTVKEYKLP
ncbi:hypothetical protein KL86SPO_50139 [uncultured Sporomusa sp.]|uniref:Uncharacterized protein n=1 Tax=uncultured Sporomusa sp. TaxID=307249 RepID=A0A212LXV9_9FIRM|nr:hypothetical protein [uncultured Sporomusa sp.]SCM82368.1 hypothetical protein KL86SPO_50139 [uncultured Sporomusa sp.]